MAVTTASEDLEFEKLAHEVGELRRQSRRPWPVQVAVPALVASLASGFGGYWFGDSLADRNRAEIRRDVLATYFGVDNQLVGKRRQILNFIDATVGKEDPDLLAWAIGERKVVDDHLRELATEKMALDVEIATLKNSVSVLNAEKLELLRARAQKRSTLSDHSYQTR